jgi:hypothetical protein
MTEHGPTYNVASPSLAKHRAKARDGLAAMSYEERRAYGEAVERAVLAMQRREAMRACEPEPRPNCASRSWANAPGEVGAAVRQQQHRALMACAEQIRRARTDVEWQQMYEEAMQAKAEAIAARLLEGGSIYQEAA